MKCQIEITNACNFNCRGCYRSKMKRPTGFMSISTFEQSLKLCRELKVNEIWLHNWGEPLLHPNLLLFVRKAKIETGAKIGFTTNGWYLNKNILAELAMFPNLDFLDISFNEGTDYAFGYFLEDIYQIATKYGIQSSFRAVVSNMKEYNYVLGEVGHCKIKWQRLMFFDPYVPPYPTRYKDKCPVIEKMFVIYWDGTIVPCCQIYDEQVTYDYVFQSSKERIIEAIEYFKEHHLESEMCQRCREVETNMPVPYKLR